MATAIIIAIIFFSFVTLIKILSDNHLRKKMIESGVVDENLKYLYADKHEAKVPSALKWGIVLIAIGVAFIIGQLMPIDIQGEITAALIFIMAGIGLLIYYGFAKVMFKNEK